MDSKKMDIVMDVKVSVTVQLGTAELPMKDVVELISKKEKISKKKVYEICLKIKKNEKKYN